MTLIRDLMIGNPKLAEMGYVEVNERNAIVSGFRTNRD